MCSIAFIDIEVDPSTHKVQDIGGYRDDGSCFHKNSIGEFVQFLKGTDFIGGHNIFKHDLKYIGHALRDAGIGHVNVIDTLLLSPLLFPKRPYHALPKDDKQDEEDINNPLNDSIKSRDLLNVEVSKFNRIDEELRQIYYLLLKDTEEFNAFFRHIQFSSEELQIDNLIWRRFTNNICEHADLLKLGVETPVELAYCLALIDCGDRYSITPGWVLRNFPEVERIMSQLRNKPCLYGCSYCNQALDVHKGLKEYFGFSKYRSFGGEPLQEQAVRAAVDQKSLLAVFPTGGGKSLAFQVPALMAGRNEKGLTVVISPLQSLMKDQVDNLLRKDITDAVTINGLLDPIERANSIELVGNGSASILYIAPESMRSKTIEKLLLDRRVVRFVIDEAHCFSSWGQDFRVDYLYIGDFIKSLQESKKLDEPIPVSCFTATAKRQVIEDICIYFEDRLGLKLEKFPSKESRTNLKYKVFENKDDLEKYNKVRDLIDEKDCPTIIYVSRTKKASELAIRLNRDGYNARMYHGKLESQQKTVNQDAFMRGEVQVMVATSAFGMGVDKEDVGMVIHYEISDSLENYVQESGRAGRNQSIQADCYVLFNEDDLGKHFSLLNNTKLNLNEIKQIWNAIKYLTKFQPSIQKSTLEIARSAGWDDTQKQIETRVKTAISALEEAGYLRRKQNMPRVFANSILTKTAQEAIDRISGSNNFDQKQKEYANRIIKSLISSKSTNKTNSDEAEARVDYISDKLGIPIREVIGIVNLLREERILADAKDLKAFIGKGADKNRSMTIVKIHGQIENFLARQFNQEEKSFQIKELNELAEKEMEGVSVKRIKTIINFWVQKNWIKRRYKDNSNNHLVVVGLFSTDVLKERLEKRHSVAEFIVGHLNEKSKTLEVDGRVKDEVLAEFSVLELLEAYGRQPQLFEVRATIEDIEDALFFLSRIEAIKIEGGFLVIYNKMTIERLENNTRIQYKEQDYEKLKEFYDHKIEQIHIVGEYAKKMIESEVEALGFVDDYFHLNFPSFINKYFGAGRVHELKRNLTPRKYRQLIGDLSEVQRNIIQDGDSKYIVVAAGPGSGKTKILAHKLASLILLEDVKQEQLLMLTFSRASVTEFKKRLMDLIGSSAHFVEIKTFHSYCFDLLGKIGSGDNLDGIVRTAVEKINNDEIERSRITKSVLVIDEAQDINGDQLDLIVSLIYKNVGMRVLAVGDDDQNIFEWRGADSRFLKGLIKRGRATKYEMTTNYRSKANLVSFGDQFVRTIQGRLKKTSLKANQFENGKISIHRHKHGNLIIPLIEDIRSTELSGTTCVLTTTNEEASLVSWVLNRHGMNGKLIQSKKGFKMYNLAEVRYFLGQLNLNEGISVVTDEDWKLAKNRFDREFGSSINPGVFEVVKKMINDFERTHSKKYISDFREFVMDSEIEHFMAGKGDTIIVSTIHKAKGKEFDHVFLLLDNFDIGENKKKRQLYVALTRAKENLTIHTNGKFFDHINTESLLRIEDNRLHTEPNELILNLDHKDVNLGYFGLFQERINGLKPGDRLTVSNEGCGNVEGKLVLKFSIGFLEKLNALKVRGFELKDVKVDFIVFWFDDYKNMEVKIVLPELFLEKVKRF